MTMCQLKNSFTMVKSNTKQKKRNIVISLGGSLIVPNEIDTSFLKKFKKIVDESNNKFQIICGGGKTARTYIKAAQIFTKKTDYVGIATTMLNAELVKWIFDEKYVYKEVLRLPKKTNKKITIYGGDKPNHSSDYDAVLVSHFFKNCEVINLTNVDYVYDKNPHKYKTAKPFEKISWKEFKKLVGNKWIPGLNLPFDPIGAKYADKHNIKVIIMNGNNLNNLKNYLEGKKFKGTIIEN